MFDKRPEGEDMSQSHEHTSRNKLTHFCVGTSAVCFIAAFISALYYAFQVSVADGVLYDPIYLWNFSCLALVVGFCFGLYALWRMGN